MRIYQRRQECACVQQGRSQNLLFFKGGCIIIARKEFCQKEQLTRCSKKKKKKWTGLEPPDPPALWLRLRVSARVRA